MELRPVLPAEIEAAAADIVAAHARMLRLLREHPEPIAGWDVRGLEELDASCERWLGALRRNMMRLILAARETRRL